MSRPKQMCQYGRGLKIASENLGGITHMSLFVDHERMHTSTYEILNPCRFTAELANFDSLFNPTIRTVS